MCTKSVKGSEIFQFSYNMLCRSTQEMSMKRQRNRILNWMIGEADRCGCEKNIIESKSRFRQFLKRMTYGRKDLVF